MKLTELDYFHMGEMICQHEDLVHNPIGFASGSGDFFDVANGCQTANRVKWSPAVIRDVIKGIWSTGEVIRVMTHESWTMIDLDEVCESSQMFPIQIPCHDEYSQVSQNNSRNAKSTRVQVDVYF